MKIAPALAGGNTFALKAPELGLFAVQRLGQPFLQAALPSGVLKVIAGEPEAGQALIRHPNVSKVSFAGSPLDQLGQVLGVHAVGAGAAEIVITAASLMQCEALVEEAARLALWHPSSIESLAQAAADLCGPTAQGRIS
jgi:delta 1-pyrroline-5-carboxylate dehydrogenase